MEALCSGVLQNRAIRRSANKRSNSLGPQQKERTTANSLFDPDNNDDEGDGPMPVPRPPLIPSSPELSPTSSNTSQFSSTCSLPLLRLPLVSLRPHPLPIFGSWVFQMFTICLPLIVLLDPLPSLELPYLAASPLLLVLDANDALLLLPKLVVVVVVVVVLDATFTHVSVHTWKNLKTPG